jgi:hypothetical protein
MVNEPALRDVLLAFATDNRSTYVMLSSLLNEVAALRETVRGLDPTFSDVLKLKQGEEVQRQADIVQSVILGYDAIIQRLNAGGVC